MTEIDRAWERTREGSHAGFASWVRLCERPLRRSLCSFARVVDVESVLQEGLLRMWTLAPTRRLEGDDASLRLASRVVRNLALSEARRLGVASREQLEVLERCDEGRVEAEVPADPALRRAILECIRRLPRRPRQVLEQRLSGEDDRILAERLQMRLNTFLQNIVRARRLLRKCLADSGVPAEEGQT